MLLGETLSISSPQTSTSWHVIVDALSDILATLRTVRKALGRVFREISTLEELNILYQTFIETSPPSKCCTIVQHDFMTPLTFKQKASAKTCHNEPLRTKQCL